MRHAKWVLAAAVAVVLGLVGAACSSGGDDSSPEMATTEVAVGSVAAAETVARPDTTAATTTSAPAALGTGQAEPVPSDGTAGSGSAEPAPAASPSGSADVAPLVSSAGLRDTQGTFRETAQLLEDTLSWLGFTPRNVCGAPDGYSFTDLLQPTREWSEELKVYSGDAIFTTDRLIELHGGPRINPEENLEFYIREAVQTAHDMLRLPELLDETEAPQMILCRAWKMPSFTIPGGANAYWYTLLTPEMQPRTNLLSQGTYHVKEISRNGNQAHVIVCHPVLRERHIILYWREAGYRAEYLGDSEHTGCQGTFDNETSISEDSNGAEDAFVFSFGEHVFPAADLQSFPRS